MTVIIASSPYQLLKNFYFFIKKIQRRILLFLSEGKEGLKKEIGEKRREGKGL